MTVTTFPVEMSVEARQAGMLATAGAVAGRTVRKFLRTPQLLVVSLVSGAMFLLIFRYVFGGAIETGGVPYVHFLVPGYVVSGVLFTGSTAAAGMAADMEDGFVDRLRSLPVSRTAILTGRVLAETALLVFGLSVTTAIGFAVGFRVQGDWTDALAGFALTAVFGLTFMWVFMLLGMLAGNAQAAEGMALMVFPVSFVSSAMVPVASMPGWLQPIAHNQPVTAMINAVRSLVLGGADAAGLDHSTGYWVAVSLVWCAALLAVFVPLAVRRFRVA
jgi:ABC transporter DrrB family efflux protein